MALFVLESYEGATFPTFYRVGDGVGSKQNKKPCSQLIHWVRHSQRLLLLFPQINSGVVGEHLAKPLKEITLGRKESLFLLQKKSQDSIEGSLFPGLETSSFVQ